MHTAERIAFVRRLLNAGMTVRAAQSLARISRGTVQNIAHGKFPRRYRSIFTHAAAGAERRCPVCGGKLTTRECRLCLTRGNQCSNG